MNRLTISASAILSCGALLCTGCGWIADTPAVGQVGDARQAPREADGEAPQAKTRVIRTLLKAVDEAKGEKQEVKDELRRALLEADAELAAAIGQRAKRPILAPGRRPKLPTVGVRAPGRTSKAAGSNEPQTAIVKALLEVLDEVDVDEQFEEDGEGAEGEDGIKDRLARILREADVELREVLGSNSKRRILQANRKAPALVIGPGELRSAKPKKAKSAPEKR